MTADDYAYIAQFAHEIEANINRRNDLLVAWLLAMLEEHCRIVAGQRR